MKFVEIASYEVDQKNGVTVYVNNVTGSGRMQPVDAPVAKPAPAPAPPKADADAEGQN
jgi:hypothetical protein